MNDTEPLKDPKLLAKAHEISMKHGLRAEFLHGAYSVGVRGDARSYLPVVVLIGPFPGWDVLEKVSTEITNTLEVGRVTYELANTQKT